MNLSPPLQYAMTLINRALMEGDQAALLGALESVPLPELLGQDTLEKVRARGKSALAIFLATLASNNEVEVPAARFWLACYQSVSQKALSPELQSLQANNVLRKTLEALMSTQEGHSLTQARLCGQPDDWIHALELAVDHKQWALALAVFDSASPAALAPQAHRQVWLRFSRLLAQRHNLFVDNSGQTHVNVDYRTLAALYERCERYLSGLGQKKAAISVAYLQAKCLEADKQFDAAIRVLQGIGRSQATELKSSLINAARCECKQGKMSEAIATLDRVVERQIQQPQKAQERADWTDTLQGPDEHGGKPFDVAKASLALADLATLFETHRVPFFLVSGTLLGYAREGQLLKHDKDIDVGVLGWEQQYTIGMALQKSAKFSISTDFLKGQQVYYIPISHNATGFIIDLFFYREEKGKYVTGVDFFFGHQQTFAFSPFELQKTEFLGVPMYVPSDVDLKLTENFGDWRTPDPGYISHLEAPCTVNPGGKDHMLTARLQLINALNEHKLHKVQRIVRVLEEHALSPWAMKPSLLEKLRRLAPASPASNTQPLPVQEVAHA